MKKFIFIFLVLLLFSGLGYSGNPYYVNWKYLFKPVDVDFSQVSDTNFLYKNIDLIESSIDGIKVWGTGGNFNDDDKFIVFPNPINLNTANWVLIRGLFYIPHTLADWDTGFGLATTNTGSFDVPNGLSFTVDYRIEDNNFNNAFINYLNANYESKICYDRCISKEWVIVEFIINPYDKAFVMKVNGREAYYAILDPNWMINEQYYISLFGDSDDVNRKDYFDYIKIYQASYSFEEGYKKVKLIYESEFDNSDDLYSNWIFHNNPPHSLTTYDGESVLALWGEWNLENRFLIFNKPLSGITIIETRIHIGDSYDHDAGILVLNSLDNLVWDEFVAFAQVDTQTGDYHYDYNYVRIKRNDGNWVISEYPTPLIFGWFEARMIYDSQSGLIAMSIPVIDFWSSYTTGSFPENVEIRILGDTDASDRKVYIDWFKIYKAENIGSLGNPEYDKSMVLFSSGFDSANGLTVIGSPGYTITTFDGASVLGMWGNYDTSGIKVGDVFSPQLIIELRGYIGLNKNDYDIQIDIFDKTSGKLVTAFNYDNYFDGSNTNHWYGVGLYVVTPSGQVLKDSVYFEPDVSGWVTIEALINYDKGICIMRVPKINFEMYSSYCKKILTSPIVYLDLVFDTDDYARYAYVKSIEVEYIGLKTTLNNDLRLKEVETIM